jgi:hypothetical protein
MRFLPLVCRLSIGVALAVCAARPLGAGAAPAKPRGLWFWSKPASPHGAWNVLGDPAREAEALATFARWNIRRLYGSYAALPVEEPARVAAWNRRLAAAGVRSDVLFSHGGALTPPGRAAFLRQIDEQVLAFNAARRDPAERFQGVALDVEPHALPRWKAATAAGRREMLEEYLALTESLRAHLDARGGASLAISAALAYWLDRTGPDARVGWRSAADRDAWFARLARSVPAISLMAYERGAPAAILEATAWERAHFPGRALTALRARLGVEWPSLAELERVLPAVEAAGEVGVDLENYELLRVAEAAAGR